MNRFRIDVEPSTRETFVACLYEQHVSPSGRKTWRRLGLGFYSRSAVAAARHALHAVEAGDYPPEEKGS